MAGKARRATRSTASIIAALVMMVVTLLIIVVPSVGASTDLIANGDFELSGGSLTGWSQSSATLTLAGDGFGGGHAAGAAYSGTGSTYALRSTPQSIKATAGLRYAANAQVRSDTPGKLVCIKIAESGTMSGSASTCATATGTWAPLPEVTYQARATGDKLVVWVIQKKPIAGNSFEADNISLMPPLPGAPANLHTTSVTSGEVDLAWDASSSAGVTYTLYRGTSCASLSQLIGAIAGTSYADTGVSPSTAYAYTVDAYDGSTHSSASNCVQATTLAPPPPVIAAVGDIACDPLDKNFNSGNGQSNRCAAKATAALVNAGSSAGTPYNAVLPLGDLQYSCGSLARFNASYDLAWGVFSAAAYPVLGNHEYDTLSTDPGCDTSASGYFQYFANYGNQRAAGVNGLGYYSTTMGTWHVIALNSNCQNLPRGPSGDGCSPGSPQETWLQNDLAANPATCTLAYWHHAPWASRGTYHGTPSMRAMWADLANAGADLVLVGHYHDYERFSDLSAGGTSVPDGTGMREIVAGTGGESLQAFETTAPGSQVRDSSTYGILSVTLGAGSYSWHFIPTNPGGFTDSGTDTCH